MPGMSGPHLQQELLRRGIDIPIIFITAQSGETLRIEAMRRGARAWLNKPFNETSIVTAVQSVLNDNVSPAGTA
jgi:FixJ family two-component response regulator